MYSISHQQPSSRTATRTLSQTPHLPLSQPTESEWTTVTHPRKRSRPMDVDTSKQGGNSDYWLGEPVATSNSFDVLAEEGSNPIGQPNAQTREPKPPPIFISGVKNIKPLTDLLGELAQGQYTLKTLSNVQVKVQPLEGAAYTSIIKALTDKKTEFHTYKPKQDKAFRVVLKNVHPTTDLADIKRSISDKGHEVTNIWNIKQRNTNKPLPMFFVDLKPQDNNKDIYNIKLLLNTCVQFEAPHARREIPQCMKCQRYGHTKHYCNNTPCCVKCVGTHLTKDCTRTSRYDDVTCVNCHEHHPANYRGCVVHKQLQQKIYPALRQRILPPRPLQPGITYAQALTSDAQSTPIASDIRQHTAFTTAQPNKRPDRPQRHDATNGHTIKSANNIYY